MPKRSRTQKPKKAAYAQHPRRAGAGETRTVGADENVFEALQLPDADRWLAKAELARAVAQCIGRRGLTQAEAATLLGVAQSDISNLACGKLTGYSMDRLCRFLNALGHDVEIVVQPKPRSRKSGTVRAVVRDEKRRIA